MPLARFSDPVKVTVSLCSKTLWDERIPNWVETLVCNCLIPFCLIQEKERERERDAEAQTAREGDSSVNIADEIEWHEVEYSGWFSRTRRSGSSSFVFFLYRHRWDESARGGGGFCCLGAHRRSVLYDPDVPGLFDTEAAIVCANKTSLPSDHFHWTIDTVWKYVLCYSGMGKGSRQQYLLPFSILSAHQKTTLEKMQQCCQGLHSDPIFFFYCSFLCPLHKE